MLSRNVPLITVSRMLGHAKPSITLDYYGHLVPGAQEVAVNVMDEIVALTEWDSAAKVIGPELRQNPNE